MITEFTKIWDSETKEVARKCVNSEFIHLIAKGENGTLTKEEELHCKELSDGIIDGYGMWYISDMIWRIEHALADNREPMAKLVVSEISSTLSSESYWKNVFKNDISSEEAKNLKNLSEALKELLRA
jgi:hypothetical protein